MNYFVIQVKTGSEEKFLNHARIVLDRPGFQFFWPRRSLTIRKQGVPEQTLAPIFPGYVFVETEAIEPEVYWKLKTVSGFYRFLRDNHTIMPIGGEDRRLLLHFLSFGEIIHKSAVYFDENNRIRVVTGPLAGLEGMIVKVDRRKQRAKIRLNLYDESFLVDFGFEFIVPHGESSHGETEQQSESS